MKDVVRWARNQSERSTSLALFVAGLISLWLGWLGVSSHVLPSEQIAYLASGGLLGLFLLGAAATLWMSADLRDEWRQLDVIAEELRRANDLTEQAQARDVVPGRPATTQAMDGAREVDRSGHR
jgi:hypothetical protein